VINHIIKGHRQRAVVALDHHAKRIADQNHVHTIGIENCGEAGIICGQCHQLVAITLVLPQLRHGQFGPRG
jgi:hypothetical protein